VPEHLSNQSFSSISPNRVADFSRSDDTKSRRRRSARGQHQREVTGRNPVATVEDPLKLAPAPHTPGLVERVRRHGAGALWRGDSQPFAAFRAAAFQHQTAVFGSHSGQESVSLLAMPAVGLESAFHDVGPLERAENAQRNVDFNGGRELVSIGSGAVLKSLFSCDARRVSPRSFPQLWKKLWKSHGLDPCGAETVSSRFSGRIEREIERYSLKFFITGATLPRRGRP
jgi:hypothetical protein